MFFRVLLMKIVFTAVLTIGLVLSAGTDAVQAQGEKQESAGEEKNQGRQGRRRGGRRGRQSRPDDAPKAGDLAPVFTLESYDGKSETSIEAFHGDKPVVLFFGSYT